MYIPNEEAIKNCTEFLYSRIPLNWTSLVQKNMSTLTKCPLYGDFFYKVGGAKLFLQGEQKILCTTLLVYIKSTELTCVPEQSIQIPSYSYPNIYLISNPHLNAFGKER